MNTNANNPDNPQQPPSQPAQASPQQPQQQHSHQPQQSQQSPRARMQALQAIGDRDRTDAEWDELNELEILLAPGNREGSTMPTSRRGNTGPMQSGRREMQGTRPGGGGGGGGGGGNAGGGGGNGPGNPGNPQGKRAGGKKFHRGPRKPNTNNNPPRQG